MAYTVTPTPPINSYIKTNLVQVDYTNEPIKKGFLLYNALNANNYQLAMRAYEGISQPGIKSGSIAQQHVLSAQNTTATNDGGWYKAADVMILVFTREHPVASMAGTFIDNEFAIVGPHGDIVDESGAFPVPIMTRGIDFATAANRPESLGALVDWLEDALVVEVLKVRYPGEWTYNAAKTRFANLPKQYDSLSTS
jgi:hypothetical protein